MRSWLRRHALILGPYLLVVTAATVGFRSLEAEGHERCLNRQADREVLRQVVDISTGSSAPGIDLTVVPGFNELDEPTKVFMRNLSAGLSRSSPSDRPSLHDQLLAKLPPIDC